MMDQGDAEILERIETGERLFRPGGSESSRRMFEVLVHHLCELRERGLIDMPDRSVTQAAETEGAAYLMAGPCFLTDAGRAALDEFRRPERRQGDRRVTDRRRQSIGERSPDEEHRQKERRRGERRE
jgi:hypothetical protein